MLSNEPTPPSIGDPMFKIAIAVLFLFTLVLLQVDALSSALMTTTLEHLGLMNNGQTSNIFPHASK